MQRALNALLFLVVVALIAGCTGTDKKSFLLNGKKSSQKRADSIYTRQAAMSIYAYQPERALRILDSAVIVGNLSEVRAEICKVRIYSSTKMPEQLDSLLHGPKGVSLNKAQEIGEQLLKHDSVKNNINLKYSVLEDLATTDKMQNDTVGWMNRLGEFIKVCNQMGEKGKTPALRTEAELGAALCCMGQRKQGMVKLDSAIYALNQKPNFRFNELDALIIALKRKILILSSHNEYAETLPLARRIIELLDDYEKHPDAYHDGSYREPKNKTKRADYIAFYRNQAHSIITAAYASLGDDNMLDSYAKLEKIVRDATAREHIARYNALQQKMEAERLQAIANKSKQIAYTVIVISLLVIVFAVVVFLKNRSISRKNRQLAQQIADTVNYKHKYMEKRWAQEPASTPNTNTLDEEQLFQYINDIIIREKLFTDSKFGRQTIMDRFNMSKERVGTIFSKGSEFTKLSNYIQQLRLEYAAKLLVDRPDINIIQLASECGFSNHTYFSSCFRQHFGISPTDFRKNVLNKDNTKTHKDEA